MQNSTCSISGCETKVRARGYCASHYARWSRYGDAEYITPRQARINATVANGGQECVRCHAFKSLDEFNKDSSRPSGYRTYCKECAKEPLKAWREQNRDHLIAYAATYREANAEWYREYMTEYLSTWKRENTDKVRDYTFRRRALKANTSAGPIDYDLLWEMSGGVCALCDTELDRNTPWPEPQFASVDHILPLARGGEHVQENLQYACLDCNVRKGAKIA